ncbi:MAG: hypothetical protein JSS95_08170 [Acidobacteria bacterium]|nr:hypothetical protein [Acidobacteriota bacterium]
MDMVERIKLKSMRDYNSYIKMAARKNIGLLLLSFVILTPLVACNTCSDALTSELTSDDGQLTARVFERNCGATTDYSSIVNLQKASDKSNANDGVLFVARGQHAISVKWTKTRQLLISCLSCSRKDIFSQAAVVGDIDINYSFGASQ